MVGPIQGPGYIPSKGAPQGAGDVEIFKGKGEAEGEEKKPFLSMSEINTRTSRAFDKALNALNLRAKAGGSIDVKFNADKKGILTIGIDTSKLTGLTPKEKADLRKQIAEKIVDLKATPGVTDTVTYSV